MANQPWYKEKNRLADENKRLRTIASQLMIAGAGGSPGQPYTPPKEDPRNPYVPAPPRDKLASLQIRPNHIMLPFVPKDAETDEEYGDGPDDDYKNLGDQAHGGPFYNEYGQPISDPSKGHFHNGVPLPQIEHLKQTPEEMKKNEERHKENYPHPSHNLLISNMKNSLQRENVGGTLRDVLLPLLIREYGKKGGKYKNPGALLSGMRKLV